MQELSKYFKMPEKAVAKHLGVCLTSLKKICRMNGINRWQYRKVLSIRPHVIHSYLPHLLCTADTGWSDWPARVIDWCRCQDSTLRTHVR